MKYEVFYISTLGNIKISKQLAFELVKICPSFIFYEKKSRDKSVCFVKLHSTDR